MFFNFRKKAKLEEEQKQKQKQKQEQQRLKEKAEKKQHEYHAACEENEKIFYDICHMVRSLPKKRQIVVVQRKNIFKSKSDRNWYYLKLAEELHHQHRSNGKKWISEFDDSLFAFYAPTELNLEFQQALQKFSEDGYRIQRIRYYAFNY